MVAVKISSASLATPLTPTVVPNEPETEKFVLEEIAKLVKAAHESDDGKDGVVILVDACAIRHGVRDEVKALAEKTGFPVYAAPMGKTAIDEDWERYGGVSALAVFPSVILAFLTPELHPDLPWKYHSTSDQGAHRKRTVDHQRWFAQERL